MGQAHCGKAAKWSISEVALPEVALTVPKSAPKPAPKRRKLVLLCSVHALTPRPDPLHILVRTLQIQPSKCFKWYQSILNHTIPRKRMKQIPKAKSDTLELILAKHLVKTAQHLRFCSHRNLYSPATTERDRPRMPTDKPG